MSDQVSFTFATNCLSQNIKSQHSTQIYFSLIISTDTFVSSLKSQYLPAPFIVVTLCCLASRAWQLAIKIVLKCHSLCWHYSKLVDVTRLAYVCSIVYFWSKLNHKKLHEVLAHLPLLACKHMIYIFIYIHKVEQTESWWHRLTVLSSAIVVIWDKPNIRFCIFVWILRNVVMLVKYIQ